MIRYDSTTGPDDDVLAEYAAKLGERPSNYLAWGDYGQYDTHVPVYAMATNSDDIMAESNWHAMRDALNGAIAHGDREPFDDLHELGESHWAVGPLRMLYVRVRDECTGQYTPAFRMAVELLESLSDYPLLDESDYSEREYTAWLDVMDDALDSAARTHRDADTPTDEVMFYWLVTRESGERLCNSCSPDDVDWGRVQTVYDEIRDEHYTWLGGWMLAPYVPPGQLSLL
jgi:hypothetical protein